MLLIIDVDIIIKSQSIEKKKNLKSAKKRDDDDNFFSLFFCHELLFFFCSTQHPSPVLSKATTIYSFFLKFKFCLFVTKQAEKKVNDTILPLFV